MPKTKKPDEKRKVAHRSKSKAVAPVSVEPVAVAPLSKDEEMLVREHVQNQVSLGARRSPAFVDTESPDGSPAVRSDPNKDPGLFWAQLSAATGSLHAVASLEFVNELSLTSSDKRGTAAALSGALAHMLDIGPRDGLEGLLAAQMVGVHRAAMRLLASGSAGDQSLDIAAFRLNHAQRLLRLFTLQMDTLDRHRGKAPSEQRVTVEHVHVNDGGQAVVGNVTTSPQASRQGPAGAGGG